MQDDSIRTGVVFPERMVYSGRAELLEYLQAVEGLGFDYLSAFDHVAGAPLEALSHLAVSPYTYEDPFTEGVVLLGFAAAATTRIGLATGVLVLPQRQTLLAAKQLASLDVVSDGRLRVGLGVGWNPAEYDALGSDFGKRGELLDEQVPLLRALWEEPLVTAAGRHHRWAPIGIEPRPTRHVPVWFGGSSQRALRRVARWGDGWIPPVIDTDTGEVVDIASLLDQLDRQLEEEGKLARPSIEGRVRWRGDEAEFLAAVERWRSVGVDHLGVMADDPEPVSHHLRTLETVRELLNRS